MHPNGHHPARSAVGRDPSPLAQGLGIAVAVVTLALVSSGMWLPAVMLVLELLELIR